jgi:hypothetical protein
MRKKLPQRLFYTSKSNLLGSLLTRQASLGDAYIAVQLGTVLDQRDLCGWLAIFSEFFDLKVSNTWPTIMYETLIKDDKNEWSARRLLRSISQKDTTATWVATPCRPYSWLGTSLDRHPGTLLYDSGCRSVHGFASVVYSYFFDRWQDTRIASHKLSRILPSKTDGSFSIQSSVTSLKSPTDLS